MYFDDHVPPHFHAIYNEYEALIAIEDLKIIEGNLPPRVYGLVAEWALQHRSELMQNWNKAVTKQQPDKIEPLK